MRSLTFGFITNRVYAGMGYPADHINFRENSPHQFQLIRIRNSQCRFGTNIKEIKEKFHHLMPCSLKHSILNVCLKVLGYIVVVYLFHGTVSWYSDTLSLLKSFMAPFSTNLTSIWTPRVFSTRPWRLGTQGKHLPRSESFWGTVSTCSLLVLTSAKETCQPNKMLIDTSNQHVPFDQLTIKQHTDDHTV